ncbi:MAG: PQQ-dependent sugar dehydrogenase [Pseudomonadota bacterium]
MPVPKTTAAIASAMLLACLHGCGGGSADTGTTPAPAGTPAIVLTRVFPALAFTAPVRLLQAPGDAGRWFLVEKGGMVWVFDNDPGVTTATPFLDLTAVVDATQNESGLLGMAFHPDWGVNGSFEAFLSYTRTGAPLESVVARYRSLDGGATLDAGTAEQIMTLPQPFVNHNGGNIEFGPDGYLYAGWGDGGGAGDPLDNAQDTMNLFGAITRVDIDAGTPYAIPSDNPFAANAPCTGGAGSAPCPELFAWGLRNPWRWSFDAATGALWAGDVGQNAIEEVDIIAAGGNYGWRCREGSTTYDVTGNCPTGLVDPVAEYDHGSGRSITGGYVYRGAAIPDLYGYYVFGDFATGRIWALPATGGAVTELLDTPLLLSAFAVANDAELYALDFAGGAIYSVTGAP